MFAGFRTQSLSKTPTNNNPFVLDPLIEGPQLMRSNIIATKLVLH